MNGNISYGRNAMLSVVQNVQECEKALRQTSRYARENCSLDGAFGLLLQPLQGIHNNARDAVMDNLETLGDTLLCTAQGVVDSLSEMERCEQQIQQTCQELEEEINQCCGGESAGGGAPGGGGSGGGSTGGRGVGGGAGGVTPAPPPVEITPPPETPKESEDSDDNKDEECCKNKGCKDPDCKGCEEGDENPNRDKTHPLGCRCQKCDQHPAGCQCEWCLESLTENGCASDCGDCKVGKPHAPQWVITCGGDSQFGESGSVLDQSELQDRWGCREPMVIQREPQIDLAARGAVEDSGFLPGSLRFDTQTLITQSFGVEPVGRVSL